MPRYIDADDLDSITVYLDTRGIIKRIEAPTADVAEVKHGKWVFLGFYDAHKTPVYECTNCHKEVADNFIEYHYYCLHCGAKMDEVKR